MVRANSFDDAAGTYRFCAYNDGRYLDTELAVKPGEFAWGYTAGPAKVSNTQDHRRYRRGVIISKRVLL